MDMLIPDFILLDLTKKELDLWRISAPSLKISTHHDASFISPICSSSCTPGSKTHDASTTPTNLSYINLTNFLEGIKCDATIFDTFKDERYFDAFWRMFKATVKAQGLGNLFVFNYTPPPGDTHAQQRFNEQQIFLYAVLVKIIQTDQGCALVCEHEQDEECPFSSPQACYPSYTI